MSKELIERLRTWNDIPDEDYKAFQWLDLQTAEAADRVEELEREVERLNRIKSRTRQAELQAENDALLAEIARLREALKEVLDGETASDEDVLAIIHFARQTLAATPEQSLARIRNQRVEDVAVMVKNEGWLHLAEAIRTMKEQ